MVAALVVGPAFGDDPKAPAPPVGKRFALLICGLPGDEEHRTKYERAVETISKALTGRYGFAPSEILVRLGDPVKSGAGPALAASRGLSTREGIASDVDELKRRIGPDDTLWVVVIGHAHYDGRHSSLNLPGPDIDERAFGALFGGLKAREQLFLITTPASGFYLKPLAAPGRIVISATEADREVNETVFPFALADVLETTPEGADRDKNGSLSVLELYLAVVANVMQRFIDEENLPTEHARLDDNGDGHGTELQEAYLPPELGGRVGKTPALPIRPNDDGALATTTPLAPAAATTVKEVP